ncbi:DNA topoisomerase 2-like protein [Tanacetum coccineum]
MVLVNGCEGIGTGWSSFIPNYNPRVIIANLKRLLNGEAMVPMRPVLYCNHLFFLKDYTAHNDDTIVHFKIIMTEDQMKTARQEGFLKKFKLTTTLSTSNMHLFEANGVIKKYDTPGAKLKEGKLDTSLWYMASFHVLVQDCVLIQMWSWQTALLRQLGKASLLLENKVRFIREVVEGTIVVSNKKKDDLYAELNVKDFTPLPKETGSIIAGAVDHVGREETEEEEEVAAGEER